MTLTNEELKRVKELELRIAGAYSAAMDVRVGGECHASVDTPHIHEFREYRAVVGKAGYEHLAEMTAIELIPAIREFVPKYPNPFRPAEFEPKAEVPYVAAD